jgi:hypothetical protein
MGVCVDGIRLIKNKDKRRDFLSTVMDFGFDEIGEIS